MTLESTGVPITVTLDITEITPDITEVPITENTYNEISYNENGNLPYNESGNTPEDRGNKINDKNGNNDKGHGNTPDKDEISIENESPEDSHITIMTSM